MSLTQEQVQFAVEFVTVVVTASALALLVLRPSERRQPWSEVRTASFSAVLATVAAAAGLVVLGAACFVHGSLLVTGKPVAWIGLSRVAAASVVIVAFPYPGGPRVGRTPIGGVLLRLGFTAWVAAGAAELAQAPDYGADVALAAGSILVAGALLRVAHRSVAVRVAGSAAASLLLVVVVLALALSTVISSSVQASQLSRLSDRAAVERQAIVDGTSTVSFAAQIVEADLTGYFTQSVANPLYDFAHGNAAQRSAAGSAISTRLYDLHVPANFGTLAYANPDGTSLVLAGIGPFTSPGFKADPTLRPASCSIGRQGLFATDGHVVVGASSPECTAGGQTLGVVEVTRSLDSDYLQSRLASEPSGALALLAGGSAVASAGMTPPQALTAARTLPQADGQTVTTTVGDRLVSITALRAAGPGQGMPVYLVVSAPATSLDSTISQLFRTLYLIAFGGTVLALGLAIFTGDRITARLRRLTGAAAAVQAGDTSVRAGVPGDDEVAALGSAFDSMIDSVAAQSGALQAAAEDEARLRNRLEAVVAGMTDALVAVDVYGRITDFNRAAAELTGVEPAQAVGAPADEVIRVRGDDGVVVGRQLFRAGPRDQAVMGQVLRAGGDIPVAVSSGALRGPAGEPVGTVLVFRDMRREHEVERMKTEFLSRVGHELRTPLTGIMGYADILLRRDVPAERSRSWYEEILQSARRLLRIVEMLEFFASEGAGRIVLRPEPLDVRSLVNGITSSWSGRMPTNLVLGRRLSREEAMVSADRRWLSLAVDELIDNAVKFSPEGGRILVRVSTTGEEVEISVTDQGMGMTAEQLEVVFTDFVQADSSDTRRFGGLGLGLAVVRRVIEGHGGTVRGRSSPGRGSTFVISLPVWPQPLGASPDQEQSANGHRAPVEPESPPDGGAPPPPADRVGSSAKGRRAGTKEGRAAVTAPRSAAPAGGSGDGASGAPAKAAAASPKTATKASGGRSRSKEQAPGTKRAASAGKAGTDGASSPTGGRTRP